MSKFVCNRCNYESFSKKNVERHIAKKNPCIGVNELKINTMVNTLVCSECDNIYKTYNSLIRHKILCKGRKQPEQSKINTNHTTNYPNPVKITNIANIANAQINNITNIKINNYGSRDATHIMNGFKFQEWCMLNEILKSVVNNEQFVFLHEDVEDFRKTITTDNTDSFYSVKHLTTHIETLGNKDHSFLKHFNSDYYKQNKNKD